MAEQQLPDINGYINALPIGVDKQDKLFDAFYSDNPKSALEAIQDVPKEVRQSLLTIRGKIHKGERYDLNDILKSAGTSKPVEVSNEVSGLGAREEGEAESRAQSAKAARELALKRWEQSISKVPIPSESPKVTPSPFAKKAEPEVDEFGRPVTKPGPRLVPSLPKFGQPGERATAPPPTVKTSVKPTETQSDKPEVAASSPRPLQSKPATKPEEVSDTGKPLEAADYSIGAKIAKDHPTWFEPIAKKIDPTTLTATETYEAWKDMGTKLMAKALGVPEGKVRTDISNILGAQFLDEVVKTSPELFDFMSSPSGLGYIAAGLTVGKVKALKPIFNAMVVTDSGAMFADELKEAVENPTERSIARAAKSLGFLVLDVKDQLMPKKPTQAKKADAPPELESPTVEAKFEVVEKEPPEPRKPPEPPPVVPEPPPVVGETKVAKPPKVSTEPPPVVTATAEPAPSEPSATAPPPTATPTTPEPPTAPVPAAQPAPATTAAQVAHSKLNDQGQPVIINSPSTPTPDTTWTDPATTAVFIPEGDTPESIGNTKLEPWNPPQGGWSKISGVNERLDTRKPFTPNPSKQSASGVIVVEDDGRVWLISPTNQFGGYDNTLPKGKLDPNLTMQENAIKEAWEETGLKVDIIGVVGDYEKSTSKVRYYLAKRTGGTPKSMGWEAQAVKLATLDDAKNLLNQQIDKDIISDLEKMISSGKLAEIKDGTPRKLSTYGQAVAPKTGGSNPGGWYKDGNTEWLVKGNSKKFFGSVTPEQSDNRAANEVLASKLIRSVVKFAAPDMKLVDLEGKYGGGLGVASKKIPSLHYFNPNNYDHLEAAQKTFALHAWLANYDVLGMGYDNLFINQNDKAVNVDPGGALLFRAQGLPKGSSHGVINGLLDPSAPEFESMRTTTQEQKAVFGKMTASQLKDSAKFLESITDEKIKKLVNTYGWGSDADKAALAENLIQRKNSILQKAGITATSSVPQTTAQPPIQLSVTQPPPASPQVSQQAPTTTQAPSTPSQTTAALPTTAAAQSTATQSASTPVLTQMGDLSTNQGKFSVPQQFLDKYNQMTQDNKSSFIKVLNKVADSRTSTGSSAASMSYVQDQINIANQKISEYAKEIATGTATDFEKERKKYYSELVKPYLEYVASSGKIAKATGYVAPSGVALASVSAIPPRPQWVQDYKAQSKGIVTKGSISNEDALNNYAFLAGLFGKSHSEAKKANTILKNAQKKNGNIQPSIIDQAIQEAKQKYLQFQPFLQVIDKKWIAPITQYFTEKQPGDEFKFPYSGYVSSVPAGDIDAGKKSKFKAAQDAVVSTLSKTQKNKLKAYTGSLADSVNLSLGHYFNNGYPVTGKVKTAIKTLDAAFKKSKLGENVKLVRNIGSRFFWKWFGMDENGIADHSLDLLKGKSYTEITYASTSMNPDSTVCLQDKSKGKIKLVINAGKNFHGIKVSSFSNVPSEDEVLLPRGTTYVIREIKHTQSGASPSSNVWEVFVDIVDQTPGEIQ